MKKQTKRSAKIVVENELDRIVRNIASLLNKSSVLGCKEYGVRLGDFGFSVFTKENHIGEDALSYEFVKVPVDGKNTESGFSYSARKLKHVSKCVELGNE